MMKQAIFYALMFGMIFGPGTGLAAGYTQARAQGRPTVRQVIYTQAKAGDVRALKALQARGISLEARDDKGNTALCEATWRKDRVAFQALRSAGANLGAACMKQIPASYKTAMGLMPATQTGAGTGLAAATTAETAGLSTAAMVGIGVGAVALVGGGVALAAGGGGGGSHSAPACSGHGTKNADGVCQCNTGYDGENCSQCDSGYVNQNGVCYAEKACVNGTQVKDTCKCNDGWGGDLCSVADSCDGYKASCSAGYDSTTTCKHGDDTWYSCDKCDSTHIMFEGQCYDKIDCKHGGSQTGPTTCTCVEPWNGTTCETCTGIEQAGECYENKNCDTSKHLHQEANECVCDTGYPHEYNGQCYAAISGGCGTNKHQQGDTCVCDSGYTPSGETCILDQCPANQYKSGDTCKACPDNSSSPVGSTSADACVCNNGYSKSSAGVCVYDSQDQAGAGSTFKLGVDTGYKVYTNTDNLTVSASNKPGLSVLNSGIVINKGNISGEASEYVYFVELPGYGSYPMTAFGGIQGLTGYFDSNALNGSSIKLINNANINLTYQDTYEKGYDYSMAGMLITPKYNTLNAYTKDFNVSVQNYSVEVENNGNIEIGSKNNNSSSDDYGIAIMPGLGDYIELAKVAGATYISPTSNSITVKNKGSIHLNSGIKSSGIYVYSSNGTVNIENTGDITFDSLGNGIILEGNTSNGNILNLGNIQLTKISESMIFGSFYGIKSISNTVIENNGNINLSCGTLSTCYGIYNTGKTVLNDTKGVITVSDSGLGSGIYIDLEKKYLESFNQDSFIVVENKGTINAGTGIEVKLEGINETTTPTIKIINSGTINNSSGTAIASSAENYSGGVGIALSANTNGTVANNYNVTIENSGTINTGDSKGSGILGLHNELTTISSTTETITNLNSGIINGTIDALWGATDEKNGATIINSGKIYSKRAYTSIVSGKKITNLSSGTIEYEADMNDYLFSGNPLTSHISGLTNIYNYGTLKNVGLWGTTGINGSDVYNYGNFVLNYDIDKYLIKGKYVYNEADITSVGFTGVVESLLYGNIIKNKGDLTLNNGGTALHGGNVTNQGEIQVNGYGIGIIGVKIHNLSDITLTGGTGILNNVLDEGTTVAVKNEAKITLAGNGMGISANGNVENSGNISIKSGTGISGSNASITNTADITVTDGDSYSVGIYADKGAINNSGTIIMNAGTGIKGYNTSIINTGNITITNQAGVGIYAVGGSVSNSGTITIAGESKTGEEAAYCATHTCYDSTIAGGTTMDGPEKGYYKTATWTGANYHLSDYYAMTRQFIVLLGGATFATSGTVNMASAPLAFSSFTSDGTGKVVALPNAQFVSDIAIKDNLYMSNEFITNNFANEVVAENMIQTPDASGLNLISQSALFDAQLAENGTDVIMTKKSFATLTGNGSLASFLERNYTAGRNEGFFNTLKSLGTVSEFNGALRSMTGLDNLTRFAHEDLTALRDMNLTMNAAMFANDDKPLFQTQGSLTAFSFKNDRASGGQYALANRRISPSVKVGYALSMTRLNTGKDTTDTRNSTVFQVATPVSLTHGRVRAIMTPTIGFARGHYNRSGFNGTTYKGTLEKRFAGVMNEARVPMTVAGWEVSPTMELNAVAYNQRGNEEDKAFSLTIPSDNRMSVEGGMGLHVARTYTWGRQARLNLTAGIMGYREFANPYNIKMGMSGMDGTFDLYDDRVSAYRGVANLGLDFTAGEWQVFGTLRHYMERETHTDMTAGLKYRF